VPYLQNKYDVAAVAAGIENLKTALAKDPKITIRFPAANTTTADFLASYPLTTSERSANHWIGSCKMGLDSGLVNNGTAVVDTNTKVYGTDNLFVVDASIFPGMMSTNPSALIVSAAEHASQLILSVEVGSTSNKANITAPYPANNGTTPLGAGRPSGTAPAGTAPFGAASTSKCTTDITITRSKSASSSIQTAAAVASSVQTSARAYGHGHGHSHAHLHSSFSRPAGGYTLAAVNNTLAAATATAPTVAASGSAQATGSGGTIAQYQRCGGIGYSGSSQCASGLTCKVWNAYYSQCVSA